MKSKVSVNVNPIQNKTDVSAEIEDQQYLRSLEDSDLYSEGVERFRASYAVSAYPFEEQHAALDRFKQEAIRRGRPEIYDRAFLDM